MNHAAAPPRPGTSHRFRGIRLRQSKRGEALQLHAIEDLSECPSCGYFQRLPELQPGEVANCRRCHNQLGRRRTNPPISTPLAFCIASAVLYIVAVTQPIMALDLFGRTHTIDLLTGPIELWREGWHTVAVLVSVATVFMPPIVIGLMLAVLAAASREKLPHWAPGLMRRYVRLRPWSMIEVYMLGILVAYTKLIDLAHVTLGPAVYALAAMMITMAATDSTVDIDLIWRKRRVSRFIRHADGRRVVVSLTDSSETPLPPARRLVSCTCCTLVMAADRDLPQESVLGHCPRCQAAVRRRKPESVSRCLALVGCAIILYVPANLYPIMTIIKLNRGGGHTILAGVRELYEGNMLPLALLVFFASVAVPVLKIIGLVVMCVCSLRGSSARLVDRSRLFRIVDFIGRWSMIDVFMVSILVALVRYQELARITADGGMFAFASVVVLTIFAADCFDPRVMWDAAGMNGIEDRRAARRDMLQNTSSKTLDTESVSA